MQACPDRALAHIQKCVYRCHHHCHCVVSAWWYLCLCHCCVPWSLFCVMITVPACVSTWRAYFAATAHLRALHSLPALGIQPLVPQAAAVLVGVAALPQHLCQIAPPPLHLGPGCLGFACHINPQHMNTCMSIVLVLHWRSVPGWTCLVST